MSNRKAMIISLIAELMKKTLYTMIQYFPKPYGRFGGNIKVELDLSSYATKANLKGPTGTNTSNLTLKSNLAKLKPEVDKIDADKLKTVPVDKSKISDVVNNGVLKKTRV